MTDEELREIYQQHDEWVKRYYPELWRLFKREKENICGFLFDSLEQQERPVDSFILEFDRMEVAGSSIFPGSINLFNNVGKSTVTMWPVQTVQVKRYRATLGGWPIVIHCGGKPTLDPERVYTVIAKRAKVTIANSKAASVWGG